MTRSPRLICFPFAGGSKYSYNVFMEATSTLKISVVEYPGRGARFGSLLLSDVHAIADDAYNQIKHLLSPPYAFYGHSMGTLISYLVAQRIHTKNLSAPMHLFMTGRGGPSVTEGNTMKHALPRKELIETLKEIGGSTDEILNNESLMDLYEPILRADFKALETYTYQSAFPLNIPITVMYGRDEKISHADAEAWQRETIKPIKILTFPGNHFFINDAAAEIMQYVSTQLLDVRK